MARHLDIGTRNRSTVDNFREQVKRLTYLLSYGNGLTPSKKYKLKVKEK